MIRVILDTKAIVQRFYREPLPMPIEELLEGLIWIIHSTHGQEQRLDNFFNTLEIEWTVEERELLPVLRQIVWQACEPLMRVCEQSGLYQGGVMPYSFESLHRDDIVVVHNHYRRIQT